MQVQMRGINKRFGSNHVLHDVDLDVRGGEVLALLGENGAGKSTLMNILGGVLPADSGQILLDSQAVQFDQPADSLAAGISFIHQELSLIVDLPIYENLFLGNYLTKRFGIMDHETMIRETQEVFDELGVTLDPRTPVRNLDASYKQIVEIARALHQDAKLIIMDEPTASLTDPEIERVFEMVNTLRDQGVGIIFISHKLNEIMRICDRYQVLRNGYSVDSGVILETRVEEISAAMVGHEIVETEKMATAATDEVVLKLENLMDSEGAFRNVNLSLHRGEILGVTGLLGDGRSELFLSVFGARPDYSGRIEINGEPFRPQHPREAIEHGIGYVPRDRKENAILEDMSILDNSAITTWADRARYGVLDWEQIRQDFRQSTEQLDIRLTDPANRIVTLSGGNQQKVVLSRWLTADSNILILDNPTQGVDVGAKEDIYESIFELAKSGISIVVLSSEAQEIIRLCERAIVLFSGRIEGELTGEAMTEQAIMHLATGSGKAEAGTKGLDQFTPVLVEDRDQADKGV